MQDQAGYWLSPEQERLWSTPASNAVVLATFESVHASAQVDEPPAIRAALAELIGRHEVLRTVFRFVPGMKIPFQVVLPSLDVEWELGHQDSIANLFDRERRRTFDLENGPVVHASWIAASESQKWLLLTVPALLCDLPSLQILVEDLRAILAGKELPEVAVRYVQFADWQRGLLEPNAEDPDQAGGFAYWKKELEPGSGAPLPGARDATADSHRDCVSLAVHPDTFAKIGRDSLEAFLFAAWQSFLCRMTGQASFIARAFSAGRGYEELHRAVGLIGRVVPFAAHFDAQTQFRHPMDRVRDALGNASRLLEYFSPPDLPPSVANGFTCSTLAPGILKAEAGYETEGVWLAAQLSDGLTLDFHFDSSRFDRSTVERWADYFQILMAAASEGFDQRVDGLPLLPESERRKLLIDWNRTSAEYPRNATFIPLFEEQAERTPDRPAVQCGERKLTYRELDHAASRIAHGLRASGVTPGSRVGLCVNRDERAILALLGIQKAGGAYVPLSAEHPKPRLAQQLTDVPVLFTETQFLGRMPEFEGKTLCIDREDWWTDAPTGPLAPSAAPDDLAYVIFTSGSTGIPKGVGIRHRNLVNYAWSIRHLLRLDAPEGGVSRDGLQFALVSTLAADLGNTCIFPSLISGGCLHVIPHELTTDSERLAGYFRRNPIDVLKIVPSHLAALLESDAGKEILPRKFLILGGELLSRPMIEKILALRPTCEIINHYGPTETTVGSLTLQLKDYDWKNSSARSIPIGRPIANTRTYILDAQGQPVPTGVTGELFIAGDGVASGYVGRQDLTDERFVPEHLHPSSISKMYRTGDLARYLGDGTVEFLGRADDQVKIRGFRIELGEIESVAMRFPGVKRAVVLPRRDERGELQLLAWVVSHPGPALNSDQLRAYLETQLPGYMVPVAFVPLGKIPLNANGKVDRSALPSPEESAAASRPYIAPEGETEAAIAAMWAEVLHLDRIGAGDDFFEIGGHSLLATRIVSRLRKHFRVRVTVRMVFECPTVRQLAAAIENAPSAEDEDSDGSDRISALHRMP